MLSSLRAVVDYLNQLPSTKLRQKLTQFDCDVPFQFILETDSMNTGYGFDNRWFTMGYMSNCAKIYRSLPRNNFGRQWMQFGYILNETNDDWYLDIDERFLLIGNVRWISYAVDQNKPIEVYFGID